MLFGGAFIISHVVHLHTQGRAGKVHTFLRHVRFRHDHNKPASFLSPGAGGGGGISSLKQTHPDRRPLVYFLRVKSEQTGLLSFLTDS